MLFDGTPDTERPFTDFLQAAILFGQRFVREKHIPRVHLSIRDMLRAKTVYEFFCEHIHEPLLGFFGNDDEVPDEPARAKAEAVVLSLALAYYLRLPQELERPYRQEFTKEWARQLASTSAARGLEHFLPYIRFDAVLNCHLRRLVDKMPPMPGIARTRILMENLLAMLVGEETTMPCIVTGPPGLTRRTRNGLCLSPREAFTKTTLVRTRKKA